jgi:hypothetical protein
MSNKIAPPDKITLIRLSAIGDVLMLLPADIQSDLSGGIL